MHSISLLDKWLKRNCDFMHRARMRAVVRIVESLLLGSKATLTDLGRNVRTQAYEKHAIKCADRLIGNVHLSNERLEAYRAISRWLVGSTEQPWVIVDWSDVELGHEFLMLKAAVPVGGARCQGTKKSIR